MAPHLTFAVAGLWLATTARATSGPPPILLGAPAPTDEWPMTGALLVSGEVAPLDLPSEALAAKLLVCSSTLIAPDVVLIAAHCVDREGVIALAADLGLALALAPEAPFAWSRRADLTAWVPLDGSSAPPDWPDDAIPVHGWRIHPDFDADAIGVELADNHDLALVFLSRALLDVPLGVLPTAAEATEIALFREVVIVGWGQQEIWPFPGTVGRKQVAESLVTAVSPWELRVGMEVEDPRKCFGDSGGPTFLPVASRSTVPWRVIGVTSHTWDTWSGCRRTGGVDTRVDHHLDWIDASLREACATGDRVWCDRPGVLPAPNLFGRPPWADDGPPEPLRGCASAPGPAPLAPLVAALTRWRRSGGRAQRRT